jgi:hypothetical protein
MAVPLIHPQPPLVSQEPQSCWAASFVAWQEGTGYLTGTQPSTTQADLIRWLESGSGLLYESGRATPNGMSLMAGIGMMHLAPVLTRDATIENFGLMLEAGYLYLVYFRRPGAPAHAIVCYGVDEQGILVMDPWPDRGYITLPPDFFTAMTDGRLLVGFSLELGLARQVGAAVERLTPPPASGAIL